MLGQSEFGLYSLVASFVAYLTMLDFGFGNAIVRYTAKYRTEKREDEQYSLFGMFLVLYIGIGILAFLMGLVLYFNVDYLFGATMSILELDKARIMMLLLIFNISITFPLSIFSSIITAYENFIFQKLVNIVRIILNPIVMIIMLTMGYKAIGMVVVTTIFNILILLINWWYSVSKLEIKIYFNRFNWKLLREIGGYSFLVFLNIIMDKIYWSTGQFLMGIYVSASAVAIFAIAIQMQSYYMSFSTAISGLFLPKITAMVTNNSTDKDISDLFIKTGRIQYLVMAFILSGFILFGKSFIEHWAGNDYIQSYYIAIIFMIPLTIPLIQNIGISILQAKNQQKFRSYLYVIISIFSLIISIPLAKVFGGIGCALGTSFALIIGQIIIMNIYYQKKIKLNIILFWKEITKMSIPVICMLLIGSIINVYFDENSVFILICKLVIYTAIYLPFIWKFGMNQTEKELLILPIRRIFTKFKP